MTKAQGHVSRSWHAVWIPVSAETEEAMIGLLFAFGSCGCEQKDDFLVGYFDGNHDIDRIRLEIESRFCDLLGTDLAQRVKYEIVPQQDWTAGWKQHFKPVAITQRITVAPSWESIQPAQGQVVIRIDPKQAFGTGHHATTQMALCLLERRISPGVSVLDVGTGTGILAIAALKLGAGKAVALDVDPVAVEAARENLELNELWPPTRLIVGTIDALRRPAAAPFDLILANINKRELKSMLPALTECLAESGGMVITGILHEERGEMLNRISEIRPLKVVQSAVREEWLALVLRKGEA